MPGAAGRDWQDIHTAALTRIAAKLTLMGVKNGFAGDPAMIQIIAATVISVIEEHRRKILEEIEGDPPNWADDSVIVK